MSQPHDPSQPPPSQQPYAGSPPSPSYRAAPEVNPYGAAGSAYPGSRAYVEQYFGPVAGFGSRAVALLIDTLLTLIGLVPMVLGLVMLVLGAPETDDYGYSIDGTTDGGQLVAGGLLLALGILLIIGIQVWNRIFRMGRTGQSIGKKVMGLRLINEQTGLPIGAMQSFLRELLGGIVNQIFYLSYLWMLWDDNKQTLADKAVHSTVIEVPKP